MASANAAKAGNNVESMSTIAETFGLTKDLKARVQINIQFLEPVNGSTSNNLLAASSQKYSNPSVMQVLSNVYLNSDLYVTAQLFDGSNNPLTVPQLTPYHSFKQNRREWSKILELPIRYNDLNESDYLKLTLYEICNTNPIVFGVGFLSMFNKNKAALRKGRQKVSIFREQDLQNGFQIPYGDAYKILELEQKLFDFQNEEINKIPWLDRLSLPQIERSESAARANHSSPLDGKLGKRKDGQKELYYLYVDMPRFDIPVIFSDVTYKLPDKVFSLNEVQNKTINANNMNLVINSIEIPTSRNSKRGSLKAFDPDFEAIYSKSKGNTASHSGGNNFPFTNALHDPIEMKFHRLERNMNNNFLLDKELKPSPQVRDDLMRILRKPSNIELSEEEKNLIWKFRYYFSKNNSVHVGVEDQTGANNKSTTKTTRFFFMKFLKSLNWDNEFELNHVFNEIIPFYWSVERIEMEDALELLGSYFTPKQLTSQYSDTTNGLNKDIDDNQENDNKILKYVVFLRKFAVERLKLANAEEILLYLLQLVQALKYEALVFAKSTSSHSSTLNIADSRDVLKSPLASFLIDRSLENDKIGNFFYWYVKVENEDQLNSPKPHESRIYSMILNTYIDSLKKYSHRNKLPNYQYLKKQIWLIKSLTNLVEILRSTFKKGEATSKKIQFLRQYLANSSNEFLKFSEPFPLPLDPSVFICGCYPEDSTVFKSSLAPLKIAFKTVENYGKTSQMLSQIFGRKNYKYGKYSLMFKIGDDLRQDQLVIQIINLMDQLLKNENLDLKLTPYKILATSPIAGLIQFVPNETLDSILNKSYLSNQDEIGRGKSPVPNVSTALSNPNANYGILNYLRENSRNFGSEDAANTIHSELNNSSLQSYVETPTRHAITSDLGVSTTIMDNYVKSCAGYCVITYILGVGDRHLDNLLISPNGKFWHVDFGYILGHDPKPFPPLMKLPIQVIDGMGGMNHENFNIFKNYCFITYITLRKNSNLILNLFQLMSNANIPDIQIDPKRALEKVQEKFGLEMTEEEAIIHFQNLINDSVNAFLPVVIDRLHSLAQYWRA